VGSKVVTFKHIEIDNCRYSLKQILRNSEVKFLHVEELAEKCLVDAEKVERLPKLICKCFTAGNLFEIFGLKLFAESYLVKLVQHIEIDFHFCGFCGFKFSKFLCVDDVNYSLKSAHTLSSVYLSGFIFLLGF